MDFNYCLKVIAQHFALWNVRSENPLSRSSSAMPSARARGIA